MPDTRRAFLVWFGCFGVAASTHAAEPLAAARHRTRPGCLRGIPDHPYEWRTRSETAVATSNTPVRVAGVPGVHSPSAVGPGMTRMFQFPQDRFTVDRCSLSDVAIRLQSNGNWELTCRAALDGAATPGRSYEYLKRIDLIVRCRCLATGGSPARSGPRAGRPILAILTPDAVTVRRAEKEPENWQAVRLAGHSDEVAIAFSEIDRVELEFYYLQ